MTRKHFAWTMGLLAIAFLSWRFYPVEKSVPPTPPPDAAKEVIPPGIVVTESAIPAPPPPDMFSNPGDRALDGYGNPALAPENDVRMMAHMLTTFLTIRKNATDRPLSANGEWSAALRGLRSGTEAWISDKLPVFDSQHRLTDRWDTPLHFHSLGDQRWQIRSAGPDRELWNEDDILDEFSG